MTEKDRLGKDEAYFILKDIKDDIKDLNDKVTESLVIAASRDAKLVSLSDDVSKLKHVVFEGNGKPSIITELKSLKDEIHHTREDLEQIRRDVTGSHALPSKDKEETTSTKVHEKRLELIIKFLAFLTVIAAEAASLYELVKHIVT